MRTYSTRILLWYIVISSVISCGHVDPAGQTDRTQDTVATPSSQSSDDVNNNQLLVSRPLFGASALDFVMISDPFFAQLFSDNKSSGAPRFYQHAFRSGNVAELFVPLEPSPSGVTKGNIDTTPFQSQYSTLNDSALQRIILSDRVIASPLLPLLAPVHMQIIEEQRRALAKRAVQFFSYDNKIHHPKYVTVDFSYALAELGKIAAELAIRQKSEVPTLVILLDSLQRETMLWNMRIVVRTFYQYAPYGRVLLRWAERGEKGEDFTRQQIYNERDAKSVLLLNAGMHTLSGIVYVKSLHEEEPALWNDRVLVVNYWENPEYERTGWYYASVGANLDVFFKDNPYISAQIRRIR